MQRNNHNQYKINIKKRSNAYRFNDLLQSNRISCSTFVNVYIDYFLNKKRTSKQNLNFNEIFLASRYKKIEMSLKPQNLTFSKIKNYKIRVNKELLPKLNQYLFSSKTTLSKLINEYLDEILPSETVETENVIGNVFNIKDVILKSMTIARSPDQNEIISYKINKIYEPKIKNVSFRFALKRKCSFSRLFNLCKKSVISEIKSYVFNLCEQRYLSLNEDFFCTFYTTLCHEIKVAHHQVKLTTQNKRKTDDVDTDVEKVKPSKIEIKNAEKEKKTEKTNKSYTSIKAMKEKLLLNATDEIKSILNDLESKKQPQYHLYSVSIKFALVPVGICALDYNHNIVQISPVDDSLHYLQKQFDTVQRGIFSQLDFSSIKEFRKDRSKVDLFKIPKENLFFFKNQDFYIKVGKKPISIHSYHRKSNWFFEEIANSESKKYFVCGFTPQKNSKLFKFSPKIIIMQNKEQFYKHFFRYCSN